MTGVKGLTLFEVAEHLVIGLVSERLLLVLVLPFDELPHVVNNLLFGLSLRKSFVNLLWFFNQFLSNDRLDFLGKRFSRIRTVSHESGFALVRSD